MNSYVVKVDFSDGDTRKMVVNAPTKKDAQEAVDLALAVYPDPAYATIYNADGHPDE